MGEFFKKANPKGRERERRKKRFQGYWNFCITKSFQVLHSVVSMFFPGVVVREK